MCHLAYVPFAKIFFGPPNHQTIAHIHLFLAEDHTFAKKYLVLWTLVDYGLA